LDSRYDTGNGKFECCSNFAHGQLHATRNDLAEAKVILALREKKIEELEADKKDATSSSSSTSNNEHGKSEYEHDRKSGLLGNKSLEELLLGQLHAMVWTGSHVNFSCRMIDRLVRSSLSDM
jgi:hypothetical protein